MPAFASLLSTFRPLSVVQLSLIVRPACSRADTVVIAAGTSAAVQPSTVSVANVPLITGFVVSTTVNSLVLGRDAQLLVSVTVRVTVYVLLHPVVPVTVVEALSEVLASSPHV